MTSADPSETPVTAGKGARRTPARGRFYVAPWGNGRRGWVVRDSRYYDQIVAGAMPRERAQEERDIRNAVEARRPARCPVCGGLNPGDVTHARC